MTGYTELQDMELISKALGGDEAAFAGLVKRYEDLVAATVIGMLGRGPDADDVGQQVFISFYRAMDKFRGEAALGTFLTRIAINLSLNELKRRKRRAVLFISKPEGAAEPDLASDEHHAEAMETDELVAKALDKLEPKFRSVVALRMMQGYSTRETAEMLRLPVGTVLSRLSRAQDKLKMMLKNVIN